MTKNILYTLIVLILVAVAAYFVFIKRPSNTVPLAEEVAAKLEIKEYSLEGRVLSINEDTLTIRTGKVERTEQGNKFVEYDKTIKLATTTPELKVGDRAVFYGSGGNAFSSGGFVAHRVDILAQ